MISGSYRQSIAEAFDLFFKPCRDRRFGILPRKRHKRRPRFDPGLRRPGLWPPAVPHLVSWNRFAAFKPDQAKLTCLRIAFDGWHVADRDGSTCRVLRIEHALKASHDVSVDIMRANIVD